MTLPSPPGPFLQRINRFLHYEPFGSVIYCLVWSFYLLIGAPIAVLVLVGKTLLWDVRLAWSPRIQPCPELGIVITGCDTGFGKELALAAADAGFFVFAGCLDKRSSWGRGAVPKRLVLLDMDVTNGAQVKAAAETVEQWCVKNNSTLYALINNAGVAQPGLFDMVDLDHFRTTMEVNYFGVIRCLLAFLPLLKRQAIAGVKSTRIYNLTSMAGLIGGVPSGSSYLSSKNATNSLTDCLRTELSGFNIQVCTVNPTVHATPIVSRVERAFDQVWKSQKEETRNQYGTAFRDKLRDKIVQMPQSFAWDPSVVVSTVLTTLQRHQAPAEILVGIDAKLVFGIMRMTPRWFRDMIWSIDGLPVPQAMRSKSN